MRVGDKVIARGPIINEAWNPAWEATVRQVHPDNVIDIQWDRGGINYGCPGEHFMVVPLEAAE